MNISSKIIKIAAFICSVVVGIGVVRAQTPTPAKGTTIVSQRIKQGVYSVTAPGTVTMGEITAATTVQSTTGTATGWIVKDARGNKTPAGWSLTISSTDFSDGLATPAIIPITNNLKVTTQATAATSGSMTGITSNTTGTTLTSTAAQATVATAASGSGQGEYTGNVALVLTVPANSYAADYTATLTFTLQ